VDLLIGAVHFFDIIQKGQIQPIFSGPVFRKTEFGWIVMGSVSMNRLSQERPTSSNALFIAENEPTLEDLMQRFWAVEELEINNMYTIEECSCEKFLNQTITRRSNDGRFIVHLPFRDSVPQLGKSYEIAKRRLSSMERTLKNNYLKVKYVKSMKEYERLGQIELALNNEIEIVRSTCYLPHHAIIKESSSSTKLRVVFDASCKIQTSISLNEVLLKGPVIQYDIVYILMRFRMHNYVLSVDTVNMYRQILITDTNRDFQCIL